MGGVDKASVLHAVVDVMKLPEEVDRKFLYEVLLAREALGSTGVGDGIAIPHVRNPIVLHVVRPVVTLCFLERPVEFGALDGRAVTTLFTLISPTVRAHPHLLSRLGFALRDADFKAAVTQQASREQILDALKRHSRLAWEFDRLRTNPLNRVNFNVSRIYIRGLSDCGHKRRAGAGSAAPFGMGAVDRDGGFGGCVRRGAGRRDGGAGARTDQFDDVGRPAAGLVVSFAI